MDPLVERHSRDSRTVFLLGAACPHRQGTPELALLLVATAQQPPAACIAANMPPLPHTLMSQSVHDHSLHASSSASLAVPSFIFPVIAAAPDMSQLNRTLLRRKLWQPQRRPQATAAAAAAHSQAGGHASALSNTTHNSLQRDAFSPKRRKASPAATLPTQYQASVKQRHRPCCQ